MLTTDPASGEVRLLFGAHNFDSEQLETVLADVAAEPKSYATLYDALRARAADRIEPLSGDQALPAAVQGAGRGTARRSGGPGDGEGPEEDSVSARLQGSTAGLAALAHARDEHVAAGRVPDAAAFDRDVLRHSAGGYAPGARAEGPKVRFEGSAALREPSATAAAWARAGLRAGTGEGDGGGSTTGGPRAADWFMDYEQQLRRTVDLWIARRHVPADTAERLRGALARSRELQIDLRYPDGPLLDH